MKGNTNQSRRNATADHLRQTVFGLLVIGAATTVSSAGTPTYTVTRLGIPVGADSVVGVRMNNFGEVAGWSQYFGQGEPSLKGWVWTQEVGFTILPPPPGFFDGRSRAMDISDTGIVAGDGGFDIGLAWRYEDGVYEITGDAEGMPIAYLGGINNAGDLAGTAKDSSFITPDFAWLDVNGGGLQTLTPGGGRATDLNDNGQVCGYGAPAVGAFGAYRWDAVNGVQPLGSLGLAHSFASRMNNAGDVVGYALSATGNTKRAWIYTDEQGMQELPNPVPIASTAVAINDLGHVVGISEVSGPDINWLWTGGATVTPFTDLVDTVAENFNFISVADINNAGQILVQVFDNNIPDFRMVILTPISSDLAGDIDGDGDVDAVDQALFVSVLLGDDVDPLHVQRSDLSADGSANGGDVQAFINAILGG